jgi:hypothetical protein
MLRPAGMTGNRGCSSGMPIPRGEVGRPVAGLRLALAACRDQDQKPNEQFGEQEFHEVILMKDCIDLTIGFLCDLAEVLSSRHSATKSAAQPVTAMSPMGHRCASDWPARKNQITALRLLPDRSRPRWQSSCAVTRPRQLAALKGAALPDAASSGVVSSEAVPPRRGQARQLDTTQPPSAPYRRPG